VDELQISPHDLPWERYQKRALHPKLSQLVVLGETTHIMDAHNTGRCPNCATVMKLYTLPGHYGKNVEVDACHECHAIWFDQSESTQLSPDGVVELFRMVHDAPGVASPKWGAGLGCVRCRSGLKTVNDVAGGSRFTYHACQKGHGRLTSFYQFLTEKKFVRELTAAERMKLAAEVKQIRCSGCAAPVNLAKQSACEYCRAPISVFDRNAAQKAIDHYLKERGKQLPQSPQPTSTGSSGNVYYEDRYSGAELAVDALWALAHFASRATRSAGTRASVPATVGNTNAGLETFVRNVGEQSAIADVLGEGLSVGAGSVGDMAQGLDWTGGTGGALGSMTESVGDSFSDTFGDTIGDSVGDAFSSSSESLVDLVGDGIGSLVSSIFD
jgi:Transcription factor zinc-finger